MGAKKYKRRKSIGMLSQQRHSRPIVLKLCTLISFTYFIFSILSLHQVDAPFFSSNFLPQHLDRGVHRKAPADFVNDLTVLASAT